MATDFDVIEADVLIIGAGIAGCRAALEAVNHGARVVMTTKGLFGRDGSATWMATLAFQCWGVHPDDPLDRHVDDTLRCGWFLNNQENVYAFLSHLPDAARELMDWGVRFRQENGQVATVWQLGQSIAEGRSFTAAQWPRGELCYNLSRAIPPVVKGRPIQIVEDTFIVDLVKNDGAVVGALGIDVRSGRFRLFQARTTILATGGYQGLYNFTTANPNLTGDGQAMALRAGADMMDFEFNQTLPCAIWPPQLAGDILPFDLILHYGGRMYNSDNERFISKWDPVNMERSSRAIISRSIFHEIKAGKTSPHGGVYTNIIHQPKSYIDEKLAEFAESHTFVRFDKAGIDLHNDSIETGYAMHYCQGGCDINTRCETDLPGLYAIGEVSSGGDGADRMTANSLPFCMCMGIIGGGEAADKASKTPMPEVDPEAVRGLMARALAPLQRLPGTRVASVRPPLQEIMAKETEYGRTEAGLKAALAEVERYQKEVLPRLFVPNRQPRLNAEWLSVLEMENMVLVAECIIRNAMLRTESRGLHDRLDYPDPSPDWFRNIHLRLADGKLKQWTVPVEFTYYRPEPGSLGEPLKKSVPVKEYRGWRAEPIYKVPKLARHGALS